MEKPRGSAEPHPVASEPPPALMSHQLNDRICLRLPEQVRHFPSLVGKDSHSFKRHDWVFPLSKTSPGATARLLTQANRKPPVAEVLTGDTTDPGIFLFLIKYLGLKECEAMDSAL